VHILAQLTNHGPDTWTVETELDDPLTRVQIVGQHGGEWEDVRNYIGCGIHLGWRELKPGETLDVAVNAERERDRVRLRTLVLLGGMQLSDGEPSAPLDGPWTWAISSPINFEPD
jgi:hypothetical protein